MFNPPPPRGPAAPRAGLDTLVPVPHRLHKAINTAILSLFRVQAPPLPAFRKLGSADTCRRVPLHVGPVVVKIVVNYRRFKTLTILEFVKWIIRFTTSGSSLERRMPLIDERGPERGDS